MCDGSPLDCRAFVVGANPATALARDFWDFWTPGTGFRKAQWLESYADERRQRGKRAQSNTRRILDRVVAAAGVRCLETNVFSTATATLAELSASARVTDPLDFLLLSVRPAIVVTYGEDARRHVETRVPVRVPVGEFARATAPWGEIMVRAEPHFSRGYGYAAAEALGAAITRHGY